MVSAFTSRPRFIIDTPCAPACTLSTTPTKIFALKAWLFVATSPSISVYSFVENSCAEAGIKPAAGLHSERPRSRVSPRRRLEPGEAVALNLEESRLAGPPYGPPPGKPVAVYGAIREVSMFSGIVPCCVCCLCRAVSGAIWSSGCVSCTNFKLFGEVLFLTSMRFLSRLCRQRLEQ